MLIYAQYAALVFSLVMFFIHSSAMRQGELKHDTAKVMRHGFFLLITQAWMFWFFWRLP